jgi:hypothetical protein
MILSKTRMLAFSKMVNRTSLDVILLQAVMVIMESVVQVCLKIKSKLLKKFIHLAG